MSRKARPLPCRLAAASLLALVVSPAARVAACPANSYRIVAYYTSWSTYAPRSFQPADVDASKITHLNYAFANVDPSTLTVVLGDEYADVDKFFPGDCWTAGCLRGNFRQVELLKQSHPDLRVLISIGGWTWSGSFSDAALTATSRQRFVQSVIDLFIRGQFGGSYGTHAGIFDGIDVDWEFPVDGGLSTGRPQDVQNYTLLMQEFRSQLDALSVVTGRPYLLSIAAGAGPSQIAHLDVPGLAGVLDHVNVMTYDFHGTWENVTNFNSPLHRSSGDPSSDPTGFTTEGAVMGYLTAGLPRSKLNVGVPFYAVSWTGVADVNDGLYQRAAAAGPGTWDPGSIDYWDVVQNYAPTFRQRQHVEAGVPWLFDGTTFVSYEDPPSITAKAAFVRAGNLGGAMIWELSEDVQGVPAPPGSLLLALHDGLCVPAPGRIADLVLRRRGADLAFRWTLDPGGMGGYHLYQADARSESGSLRAPACSSFATAGAAQVMPFTYTDGVSLGLTYYQVLSVGSGGAPEGPN